MDLRTNETPKILVTGALGQLGTELCAALRARYGRDRIIASDIREQHLTDGPYISLDVLDREALGTVIRQHRIGQVYHLAAMLSARGEQHPLEAWELNMTSLLHILELARTHQFQLFWPSSIAVFGPNAPKKKCPQATVTEPRTIYGISKLAGEQLCSWYINRYGLDIRSLRYPGLISHSAPAGGGTTDYAVEIFEQALRHGHYTCFLKGDTRLPMLYMADAVRATLELMDAPRERLRYCSYNLGGLAFTPAELAAEIRAFVPGFQLRYRTDERQVIADSWPQSIDDTAAQADWNWRPGYDLSMLTADMLQHLRSKIF